MSSFKAENLYNVAGKVVLVTGGSRGIGKWIATAFAVNGAKVYITSRTAKDCEETAKELNALRPGSCIALPADLQRESEVERLVEELTKREKALHVLVNNAGAAWGDGIDEHTDAAWTKILTLNLQRVFTLTQKCLWLLREGAEQGGMDGASYKDPARIINIGSIEGLAVANHETYAYAASKAGLHHLSRTFAGRLGWEGITSNTIACGPFYSKMTQHLLDNLGEVLVQRTPLLRFGKPEDVAGTALFLAGPAASWMSGATLTLDGGSIVAMPSARQSAKL